MKPASSQGRTLTRRRVLTSLGVATIAGVGGTTLRAIASNPDVPEEVVGRRPPGFTPVKWSDPRAWPDGRVPSASDVAVVERPIVVEGHVEVAGVRVAREGALVLSPHTSTLVESSGNVVVAGQLVMRPISAEVDHTLRFVGIDEDDFAGGGHEVIESDIGLWVIDHGLLDAQGTPRSGWLRLATDAFSGDSILRLEKAPEGWRAGDLLTIAPSEVGDFTGFEERRIERIEGDHVTLDARLGRDHPGLDHPALGRSLTAEVANLTRNVRIEGTPGGRTHINFPHAHMPQTIRHAMIRHVGPEKSGSTVLGRYGLHFHMCGDSTRGSEVEGVVIRDCGTRGFVPHASHGITFRDCLTYENKRESYWWDRDFGPPKNTYPMHASHDVAYERCAAFKSVNASHQHQAFTLGQGENNRCTDSVAVGVVGGLNAAGFVWPSDANNMPNVWTFEDCVGHNNDSNGIWVWQNGGGQDHLVEHFVAYRNRLQGISHGAYWNSYRYRDTLLVDNGERRSDGRSSQLLQHSNARWNARLDLPSGYERVTFDDSRTGACIRTVETNGESEHPLEFIDCTFPSGNVLAIDERETGSITKHPFQLHFVGAKVGAGGRDMEPSDIDVRRNENGTVVRVQRQDGTAWQMDHDGTVREITPFHP